MEDKVLQIVYTLFLGVMLALFVGFGVQTFYPEPVYPTSSSCDFMATPTADQQQKCQDEQKAYQDSLEGYNRNVSIIATASAVLMLGLSLLMERKARVVANGAMLGGFFTLLYGVGRGFSSGDTTTTFVTVAVGLLVVILLGYRRFAQREGAGPPPGAPPAAGPPAVAPPAATA